MSDGLTYIHHENDVHQVIWNDVEPDTVRDYLALFRELMENCPVDTTLRILHDYRNSTTPSFGTMARGMKELVIRDDVTLRIAHMYSDGIYPMIVKNATLVARFNANRQFFRADQEEQAVEWLLK